MEIHCKGTEDEDINKNQEVSPNAHQCSMDTEHPQLAACSTPTSPTPAQNTAVVDSETEPESEIQSDDELEYVIENQLGLPEYQCGIKSSPPPVDANIICNELNNNGEFLSRRGLQKKK